MNCRDCTKLIPQARLNASPLAERCLGCQSHYEIAAAINATPPSSVTWWWKEDETERIEAVEQTLRDQPKSSIYLQIEGLDEL